MLGEKVGEFQGKITGQRVLPPEGARPKFETTVEIRGTILGVASTLVATYWSVLRLDGRLYGENPGQGVLVTGDGDMALFRQAPRSADIIAQSDVELLVIKNERLDWLIRNRPQLAVELVRRLSNWVVQTDRERALANR